MPYPDNLKFNTSSFMTPILKRLERKAALMMKFKVEMGEADVRVAS
jgi:hypothetical protein